MDYSEVVEQFSEKLDKLTYTDEKKSMKVGDTVTIDWDSIVPDPPKNTSETTRKELEYLTELTAKRTPAEERFVKLVDKEALDLFRPIAKKFDLEIPSELIKRVYEDFLWPITYNLKFKFNRPRPEQVASFYDLKIDVIRTTTHQTPAYPSGHTVYGLTIAHIMSDMYPLHRDEFFRQGRSVGLARCLQGVHYPSDNEASALIVKAVWENIKNNVVTSDLVVSDKERKDNV